MISAVFCWLIPELVCPLVVWVGRRDVFLEEVGVFVAEAASILVLALLFRCSGATVDEGR